MSGLRLAGGKANNQYPSSGLLLHGQASTLPSISTIEIICESVCAAPQTQGSSICRDTVHSVDRFRTGCHRHPQEMRRDATDHKHIDIARQGQHEECERHECDEVPRSQREAESLVVVG